MTLSHQITMCHFLVYRTNTPTHIFLSFCASAMSSRMKTRGRQKIEMKKMSNESNQPVTFSKLHSGLFKIASELCTLCGAYVALIIFSHGEKVFSFGHTNVETVINRYISQVPPQNNGILQFIEAYRNAKVRKLNALLTRMNDALVIEKNRWNEFEPAAK